MFFTSKHFTRLGQFMKREKQTSRPYDGAVEDLCRKNMFLGYSLSVWLVRRNEYRTLKCLELKRDLKDRKFNI